MTNDFALNYALSVKEETRARRADALRKRSTWAAWAGSALFFIAVVILPKALAVLDGDEPLSSLLPGLLIFFGIFGAIFARMWFYPLGARVTGPDREVTISNEGLNSRSPVARRLLYWVNFTSAVETREFFLLRMGGGSMWPVPKRSLADSAVLQGLRDLIRAHVPDAELLDRPEK